MFHGFYKNIKKHHCII